MVGQLMRAIALLALYVSNVAANEVTISADIANREKCSGMYGRDSWGGTVDPFIQTIFVKQDVEGDDDPIVSFVIFEWKDEEYVGLQTNPESPTREYICSNSSIIQKHCKEDQLGQFIIHPDAEEKSFGTIRTTAIHLKNPGPAIKYDIRRTGYYCVGTLGYSADKYKAVVEFRNSYGELPAAQIPKLPFYGGLTIFYAVIGAFWAFLYVQHRHDILPVQNYITAIIVFLIIEMLMTWGFYDYQNRHGSNVWAKVLMVIVAVLNAGRNSFSFFLLLIVCLGYGVVKHTLGKVMLIVRGLAAAHFIFGVIYAVASLTITPDKAGPLVLLVILPLAATLTAFYVWTLNALNLTMKDLLARKQSVKAMMYKKLWWCILASIIVIFAFFFFNSFTFAGHSDPDFVPDHWQSRWFILDGWLNLVYLVDLAFVAYLWRPTANNRRFAMSDELAQDDEGFEVASFGGSVDNDDDEEAAAGGGRRRSGDYTPNRPAAADRGVSPLPRAQTTTATSTATRDAPRGGEPRQSLDGETIFAVGEDGDKWSDDDDDDDDDGAVRASGERERLTGKGGD
ncbi:MAG: hypothetical protein M1825_003420 [Sarcosagium campestre]|nr:MAG: hypothetical protein M1825_003420 [Sarcosagium campestre]